LLSRKLQRVRRADPHREPRPVPAQADRRAVPGHLPPHRVVDAAERLAGRRRGHHWPAAAGRLALRPGLGGPVRGAVPVRRGDGVQLPGGPDVDVGLAGAQSEPVRVVVAVHDADALPARDFRGEAGLAAGLFFQLHRAGAAGGLRAGANAAAGGPMALRRCHVPGNAADVMAEPQALSPCPTELPQRVLVATTFAAVARPRPVYSWPSLPTTPPSESRLVRKSDATELTTTR